MVSIRPFISMSRSPCTNPLVTVPKVPFTIAIIVIFMYHICFSFPSKLEVLISFFYILLIFTLWSVRKAKPAILQILTFLLIIIRFGPSDQDLVITSLEKPRRVCTFHSLKQILDCDYTIFSNSPNLNF